MSIRWILVGLIICLILLPSMASAKNQYYRIDGVYYNDEKVIGDAAKPTLKIGEPFTVAVEMTLYQKCEVSIMLAEIGKNNFIILEGPTQKIGVYGGDVIEKNATKNYEWVVAPTDGWADGTLPLNFVYQINDFSTGEILAKSKFTIVYPYITTEYYEGTSTPTTTIDPESPASTETPNSTPAFSLLTAALAITLAAARRS